MVKFEIYKLGPQSGPNPHFLEKPKQLTVSALVTSKLPMDSTNVFADPRLSLLTLICGKMANFQIFLINS